MLIFERLEHLKKSRFFDANYLSDSLSIPKKNLRLRAKFFRIAHTRSHSHSHSLKVLRKENDPFPDSHSLRIKGNDHRWLRRLSAWQPPPNFSALPRQFVPNSILGLRRSARIWTAITVPPLQPTQSPCIFQN